MSAFVLASPCSPVPLLPRPGTVPVSRWWWGAGVIPRLARDLRNELPEVRGFSERNIKLMLPFYREYANVAPIARRGKSATGCGKIG